MPFDLLIFDFDGTLADTEDWFFEALAMTGRDLGLFRVSAATRDALRQRGMRAMLADLAISPQDLPRVERHMRQIADETVDTVYLFGGIADALTAIRARGDRLAIVSSNAESVIRQVLGVRLASEIAFYGCSCPAFEKQAALQQAIDHCGVAKERAIYVGDEIRDVEAAQAVGMASAAVSWGYMAMSALEAAEPHYMIESIGALAVI